MTDPAEFERQQRQLAHERQQRVNAQMLKDQHFADLENQKKTAKQQQASQHQHNVNEQNKKKATLGNDPNKTGDAIADLILEFLVFPVIDWLIGRNQPSEEEHAGEHQGHEAPGAYKPSEEARNIAQLAKIVFNKDFLDFLDTANPALAEDMREKIAGFGDDKEAIREYLVSLQDDPDVQDAIAEYTDLKNELRQRRAAGLKQEQHQTPEVKQFEVRKPETTQPDTTPSGVKPGAVPGNKRKRTDEPEVHPESTPTKRSVPPGWEQKGNAVVNMKTGYTIEEVEDDEHAPTPPKPPASSHSKYMPNRRPPETGKPVQTQNDLD